MKKYKVGCLIDDREMIVGVKPHNNIMNWDILNDYIEAENEEDAIDFAIKSLYYEIVDNGYYPDANFYNSTITVRNKKCEVVEYWYDFIADKVE